MSQLPTTVASLDLGLVAEILGHHGCNVTDASADLKVPAVRFALATMEPIRSCRMRRSRWSRRGWTRQRKTLLRRFSLTTAVVAMRLRFLF